MTLRKLSTLFVLGCVGSLLFAQVAPKKTTKKQTAKIDTLATDSIIMYQKELKEALKTMRDDR